ncbi:uncharacterized protein LOC141803562 [Halichoeres trimaculatus]|uniref:uncharacterized protein LOC141803562 n=1 Tax=Halichoeres trimaculatus TaxID=147232 RepID=UPI003D9EC687
MSDFHSQVASIMEVLANAAVAEICKVVDDGYALLQLEMSRSHKESEFLRRKTKLLELQVARYRAERVKPVEGSNGRFVGVRLHGRQRADSLAGPSVLGRTRFLNRVPGAQQSMQKTTPIILDQDPDQEVVTTTKTESSEPEEEGELLIVKVEEATGTTPTHQGTLSDPGISKGDAQPLASQPTTSEEDSRRLGETEAQRCPTHLSSHQCEQEVMKEETGEVQEKLSPTHLLLDWQESRPTQGIRSLYTVDSKAASLSYRLTAAVRSVPVNPDSDRSTREPNQDRPESEFDVVVINSGQDTREISSGAGDTDRALGLTRSQYLLPQLCLQISGPPNESSWDASTYNTSPVHTASEEPQHQHSWSTDQQMGHLSDQQLIFQAPSTQDQESGSQQPHLPFACSFCPRRYSHQCKLRIHQRAHTGEKPYQCLQCGKRFGQVCSMKRHQMVHTGERPYPCPHCGKQFSTSTNLKVHQSVHTGEKRFNCTKCGKNFSFLSNLIRHQALHSNK